MIDSEKLRQALKDEPKKRLDEIYPRAKYGDFGRSLYIEGHASTHEIILSLVEALEKANSLFEERKIYDQTNGGHVRIFEHVNITKALEKLRKELGMG